MKSVPTLKLEANLGPLYARSSIACTGDTQPHDADAVEEQSSLHLAVVKLRALHQVSDDALRAIGSTIAQLTTLGMLSIVVLEPVSGPSSSYASFTKDVSHHVSRVANALHLDGPGAIGKPRAQRVDQAFEVESNSHRVAGKLSRQYTRLSSVGKNLIYSLLQRDTMPIISPMGVESTPEIRLIPVDVDEQVVEIVKAFDGSKIRSLDYVNTSGQHLPRNKGSSKMIHVDRIIILDPRGGVPSPERNHAPHVYINLRQEHKDIEAQIKQYDEDILCRGAKIGHTRNLKLLGDTLDLLTDSSSGLIVTPEAVTSAWTQLEEYSGPQVRTRSKRNPLIHNLLTDKPSISSSLPYGRSSGLGFGGPTSTFVKRGMPLTTIPDVFKESWVPPSLATKALRSLSDPEIDLEKLVRLIEASFKKKLDVNRFITRINERFAGLVVAGDYEGCALFTWEESSTAPGIFIPYLDKFAVQPPSQGTGMSVSDILFTCMIMDCFPNGVCWRSRSTNPVNKWYFERARGAWKLPGTIWTCFWTTDQPSRAELTAYESICRDIPPTFP